ncbi:hypothetical protein [Pseudomonas aeruginosa]|uniref:hypothetical protein n=1 Tax=Pseudomonas aeruginosa TaxID=287 RepID=UPI00265B01A7|nr:hypothetical protein [Pseudomonas aeruginosa]
MFSTMRSFRRLRFLSNLLNAFNPTAACRTFDFTTPPNVIRLLDLWSPYRSTPSIRKIGWHGLFDPSARYQSRVDYRRSATRALPHLGSIELLIEIVWYF